MQTRLKEVGEDLALVLDRSTWNELGLDGETEIEIAVDDTGIHIRQSPDGHRERVLESARRMMEVHEETFRKLAR
jgi:antitoxin component of MazEF toxin-antitoxin module